MRTHITMRLPEDLLKAIDGQAGAEGRTRSQMIERLLSQAVLAAGLAREVGMGQAENPLARVTRGKRAKILAPVVPAAAPGRDPDELGRYRRCRHGRNEWICSATVCKLKTNRV